MTRKRFSIDYEETYGNMYLDNGGVMTDNEVLVRLNQLNDDNEELKQRNKRLNDENNQLIKDNFELQGLLGDVRALLRLNKVDDAISRIDKFERSMKK